MHLNNSEEIYPRYVEITQAVRETSVSRHHGGAIRVHPETPRKSQHYDTEGNKGR